MFQSDDKDVRVICVQAVSHFRDSPNTKQAVLITDTSVSLFQIIGNSEMSVKEAAGGKRQAQH